MNKIYTSILLVSFFFSLVAGTARAQVGTPSFFNAVPTTSTNTIPLNNTSSNKIQWIYAPNAFTSDGTSGGVALGAGNNISKFYIRIQTANASTIYQPDFVISMKQEGTGNSFADGTFLNGLTTVFSSNSFQFTGITTGSWYGITLNTPFPYDPNRTLIVEVKSNLNVSGGNSVNNITTTGLNQRLYGSYASTTGTANTGLTPIGFDVVPNGPCVNPPVTGNVVSSMNPVCTGTNFSLSLTGGTSGNSQTYQWESSTDNVTFTPIPGATNSTLSTSQNISTYYKVAVTCGATVRSSSLLITTPPPVSGTFDINNGVPSGGSSFQTFAEAIDYIKCGINGPVVFNVAPGSSYTEQVIIPAIGGASATNTITFNGNGALINFNSINTSERAAFKLDGADYVTIKNFTITGSGTGTSDYNFGIHLLNGADNNTIKGNTINLTAASTSTNYAGIVISGSATSATSTGSNSNYNVIDSNTVNGGYYGITVNGATGTLATGNIIRRNTLQDWYFYGTYINLTDSTIVERNEINRLTRSANASTFNGIYFTGQTNRAIVSKNRIHDPFTGLTSTSAAYGIYFTSADAVAGKENIVSNNLIYNFIGGGTQYALYNSSSDSVRYYHNTVVLDDQGYTGTAVARGFYQITLATGIELKNNIITIGRGGTGAQHNLYFGTTTSSIVSNNNVLYNTSTAATSGIGFYSTNFATMPAWKAANNNAYDQASVNADPLFSAPGQDFKPTSAQVNNIGDNVGITTDIVDSTRNLSSPDPGAYEFNLGACTNPPTRGTAISSVSNICIGSTFTLNLNGHSVGDGQMYQWQSSPNGTTWTNIGPSSTASAYALSQNATSYYRARITCGSGNPVFSDSVLVTSPTLVSGTYTINNGMPTGAGNFQTFADAISFINCGINGPVVFNVATGSSFTEQVLIPEISGASATNTITFNGNDAVINFNSTTTDMRAAIRLDGADHIVIRNFTINGTGTATSEYNFGIQLLGGADSNKIIANTINLTTASTSTNYAGIVISGSASSATTSGSNSDYNLIDSNTVNGGYYGITVNGATGALATGNIIRRNTLQDWYLYGMYINLTDSSIVEKNVINRRSRSTALTTFNGIYFTGQTKQAVVNKNRVHDPFGGLTTSTSAAYGIYFNGADAVAGKESIVSNNLIYNFIGGGVQYGIYNIGSDSVRYYHNTVVLDDAGYAGTSATRGFYQTTMATGVEIKNNILTIGRGGTGTQHNLYFNTTTSSIVSNNNVLYNTSTATTSGIGFYATNFADLPAWQTANNNAYDQQSRSIDPMFLNPGMDYTPTNSLADNFGAPVGIATDIRDSARSANSPDPGAYEFSTLTAGINMSAVGLVTPAIQANGCFSANETVTIRIRNSSTSAINFATNPVTVTTNVSGAASQTLSTILNTGTLASDSTMNVVMSQTLNMSAPGIYTFNASTAVNGDANPANDAMVSANRTKVALTAGTASGPSSFCVTAPVNTTLSATGVNGNSSLQWLQSTNAANGFTAISGANTIPYTISATPTQTMYYKLVASCSNTSDSSSVVTVIYNDPQVTSTTPGSRCGSGTVSLGATGNSNAVMEWFAAANGGAPLASGSTFTTPNLTADSTYFYVAANIVGGSSGASPILVTEMDLGGNDRLEIQNVSGTPVDVTGWKVAISNSYTDINSVNANIQTLSGILNPGEVKSWTDATAGPNYWGSNILWNPGAFPTYSGWAAIIDNNNNLVDIAFMNWPSSNIQGSSITIGTATITIGNKWIGDGINTTTVADVNSVSRKGNMDNNSAADFEIVSLSIGTINPGMTLPFSGFGCSSARIPVLARTNDCPVPVTLLNFKGEKQGAINNLSWTTVTEINNAGFELQRSADGVNFSRLAYIASKALNGNSTGALNYSLDDVKPFAASSYYRLLQLDKDGKATFSPVVLIKGAKINSVTVTSIYPNPAKSILNLIISSPVIEKVNVVVTDLTGRQVVNYPTLVVSGDNQVVVAVDKLASGTYFIKIVSGNQQDGTIHKFIKQ